MNRRYFYGLIKAGIIACLAGVLFMMGGKVAKSEDDIQLIERLTTSGTTLLAESGIITPTYAGAPIGRFLLIRKESTMCALLFGEFRSEGDARPQTSFTTGEEHRSAKYEWYLLEDGSGSFIQNSAKHGEGVLTSGPLIGIGRLAFGGGNRQIKCGPFNLHWHFPNLVDFFPGNRPGDYGIELALTSWSNVSEIDGAHTTLKWFRYNSVQAPVFVPLSDINNSGLHHSP